MILLDNLIAVVSSLATQTVSSATATNGTGRDLSSVEGTVLVTLDSAAMTTADTLNITLEHSLDGSTNWTAIPADALFNPDTGQAATFTQVTDAAASLQTLAVRTERVYRYMRAVATTAGGTITATFSVHFTYLKKYANFSN